MEELGKTRSKSLRQVLRRHITEKSCERKRKQLKPNPMTSTSPSTQGGHDMEQSAENSDPTNGPPQCEECELPDEQPVPASGHFPQDLVFDVPTLKERLAMDKVKRKEEKKEERKKRKIEKQHHICEEKHVTKKKQKIEARLARKERVIEELKEDLDMYQRAIDKLEKSRKDWYVPKTRLLRIILNYKSLVELKVVSVPVTRSRIHHTKQIVKSNKKAMERIERNSTATVPSS